MMMAAARRVGCRAADEAGDVVVLTGEVHGLAGEQRLHDVGVLDHAVHPHAGPVMGMPVWV